MDDWIAFKTIAIKELDRVFRIWRQTLLPPVVTMSLYFLIFGNLIGRQIDNMQGRPYMEFIVPGLIMMAIIQNAYTNVSSSFFGAKFQRNIDEMLVSPMSNMTIIAGYVTGGVARSFVVGLIVWLVSFLFTSVTPLHATIVLVFFLLTGIVFALAGLTNGIFAQKFDDVAIVPTFVLTPLTYLGGVFYSIDLLPPFFQRLSMLNPIIYMVNGFRFGFLGVSDVDVVFGLLMLLAFATGLFVLNWTLLNRGTGLKS